MIALLPEPLELVSLPEEDAGAARDSSLALANFVLGESHYLTLQLEDRETGRRLEAKIPAVALRLLASALARLSEGRSVTILSLDADLSMQQAADILGVSRPYFVKLLEEGHIPFRKVGNQRRVKAEALRRYMASYQQDALQALGEMTAEAQRLGLYE